MGCGPVGQRVGRVVDQGQRRRADLLAQPLGEERPALEHGFTRQGARDDPQQHRRHPRVEHDGEVGRAGLGGAQEPGRPVDGVGGRLLQVELVGLPSDRVPAAGLGVAPLAGDGVGREMAHRPAGGGGDPGGAGDGSLHAGVAVVGRLHLPDTGIPGTDPLLELEGHGHLAVGGQVGESRSPQIERRGPNAVRRRQTHMLVGCGEGGVVPRLGQHVAKVSVVERPGVGETLPVPQHDPHAHSRRLRRGQRLDVTPEDADRGVAGPGHIGLDLFVLGRPPDHPGGDVGEVSHERCPRR